MCLRVSAVYSEELVAECDAVAFLVAHQQVVACPTHDAVGEVDLLLTHRVHHPSTLHRLHPEVVAEFHLLQHALRNGLAPVAIPVHPCVVADGFGAG